MHNGIVHDEGRSPGWIFLFPHETTDSDYDPHYPNGVWVRFDNTHGWPYGTSVEWAKPGQPDYRDPAKIYSGNDFRAKNGNNRKEHWNNLTGRERSAWNRVRDEEGFPQYEV